jgi:hypothetical protein
MVSVVLLIQLRTQRASKNNHIAAVYQRLRVRAVQRQHVPSNRSRRYHLTVVPQLLQVAMSGLHSWVFEDWEENMQYVSKRDVSRVGSMFLSSLSHDVVGELPGQDDRNHEQVFSQLLDEEAVIPSERVNQGVATEKEDW